ncbi:MAG TPA: SRPBCC family protein [Candidatus Thermoplasmatota archaeon]|nr:SRPBCC family protein [Candidatus Thermoplasmatota archaeon]
MIVEARVTIAASRAAVWATMTDIERAAQILTGVEAIEIVEKPASGIVGLRWRETRMYFGEPATVEKRITKATETGSYETRAQIEEYVFVSTMTLSGEDGATTLTSAHETQPQGFVARLKSIPMVFFKGVLRKALLQDLNDIKRAAENVE